MAKAKRKTLPKEFEELLQAGDLAALQAVFDACDVNARGGFEKQTALAFDGCPEALARWLVSRGADLSAGDTWGNTPLHTQARAWRSNVALLLELGADVNATANDGGTPLHVAAQRKHTDNARLLLAHGAQVDARDGDSLTPLEVALRSCTLAELDLMPALVQVLLDAGATRTPAMPGFVRKLGETFEFHRTGFNPEKFDGATAGLDYLYKTFDVPPVAPRRVHDGTEPIAVKATTWQARHAELWDFLVPSRGPAQTVQGEVIRISGRLGDEWGRNGGVNWNKDYGQMARALPRYLERGTPLDPGQVLEVDAIVQALKAEGGQGTDRLAELAVAWVVQNPQPLALETPDYKR